MFFFFPILMNSGYSLLCFYPQESLKPGCIDLTYHSIIPPPTHFVSQNISFFSLPPSLPSLPLSFFLLSPSSSLLLLPLLLPLSLPLYPSLSFFSFDFSFQLMCL